MRILKFGGTSVATANRRRRMAEIVGRAAALEPVAVVTSALAGVTDLLERAATEAASGTVPEALLRELAARHLEEALPPPESGSGFRAPDAHPDVRARLTELETLLSEAAALGECPAALRHRILACGERLALPLVVSALREQAGRGGELSFRGVDASRLLLAPRDSAAQPRLAYDASRRRVRDFWAGVPARQVVVVTGFIAGDGAGGVLTLGRGASDLTATLLARFLDASEVEIWSDVDGVLSAPPRLVPTAFPLAGLSYDEAAGLACFGAEVLHPEALAPVAEAAIPVRVRNTLRPEMPGTRIGRTRIGHESTQAAAAAVTAQLRASWLSFAAPWRIRDLLSRTFRLLEAHEIRPLTLDRGGPGQHLDLVIPAAEADRFEHAARRELRAHGVTWQRRDGVSAVALLGRGTPWSVGEILRILEEHGITPLSISSTAAAPGTRTVATRTVAVVPAAFATRALAALHDRLIRSPAPPLGAGADTETPGIYSSAGESPPRFPLSRPVGFGQRGGAARGNPAGWA